jgi:hypothetical protein
MDSVSVWRELQLVLTVLDKLGISYVLGGSLASSLWGVPRSTNDADVMVLPVPGREEQLVASFPPDFYLSLSAMREANLKSRSFNIINTSTGFKTDVFVASGRKLDESAFRRKVTRKVPALGEATVNVLSAEDVVIYKLDWYRQGGETSERQWLDVAGVLQANLSDMDRNYLREGSKHLGIVDLLNRAIAEVEAANE